MNKCWLWILFIFGTVLTLEARAKPFVELPCDFYLMSIPKAGTHLSTKLLYLLTKRKVIYLESFNFADISAYPRFKRQMNMLRYSKNFYCSHPFMTERLVQKYTNQHPDKLMLLQIRDLRDAVVSMAYFAKKDLDRVLGENSTFEERMTFILASEDYFFSKALDTSIKKIVEWQDYANVLVCRFEELVGPQGGGDEHVQRHAIKKIAHELHIPLDLRRLLEIQKTLFGNDEENHSWTFRKGHIGSWKKHFTPEQMEMFIARWGAYQLALGYSLD